jgi:hypothetical protein
MAIGGSPPKLTPRPLAGAEGWFVQVDWDDFSEQVGAFATRADACEWIRHRSADWLRQYRRPAKR